MNYESPFLLLRSPILPLKTLLDVYQSDESEQERFDKVLKVFNENQTLWHSLYIASPSLYRELSEFETIGLKWSEKRKKKLFDSTFKYFVRMCSRCTPFGLFASSSLIGIKEEQDEGIEIIKSNELKLFVRLDPSFLMAVYIFLSKDHNVRETLSYRKNSTLYKLGDTWKLIQINFSGNKRSKEALNVPDNPILSEIIEASQNRTTIREIVVIIQNHGFDEEEALEFIYELIDNQVIIDDFFPSVLGGDYQSALLSKGIELTRNKIQLVHDALISLKDSIETIKSSDNLSQDTIEKIEKLQDELIGLMNSSKGEVSTRIHIDTFQPIEKSNTGLLSSEDLIESIKVLSKLTAPGEQLLDDFKRVFSKRYEDQAVPLTMVLDPEVGIDYTENNLKRLTETNSKDQFAWSEISKFKLQLYRKSLSTKSKVIELKEDEINALNGEDELPNSFSILGNIFKTKESAQILITGVVGPSFANLATRFCFGSKEIDVAVRELSKIENAQFEHSVVAEIGHLPGADVISLVNRPKIRDYEIPYLNNTNSPLEEQLPIEDLYLCMEGNQLLLLSKKLQKQVNPRLTSAHSYYQAHNLPIYRFLGDLQQQNRTYIRWDWEFLRNEPFLPRVTYKNHILFPAYWTIETELFNKIEKMEESEWGDAFNNLRLEFEMPECVELSDGDNNLLLDLKSDQGIRLVLNEAKKSKEKYLKFKEHLFTEDNLVLSDSSGNQYTNEFIRPFVFKGKVKEEPVKVDEHLGKDFSKRKFGLGEEWLYLKIYGELGVIDQILENNIEPLMSSLKVKGIVSKWFFIRYSDPDYHLRLRLLLTDKTRGSEALELINNVLNPYLESLQLWNVSLSAYNRELERYGEKTIDQTESLFFVNSELVLNLQSNIFSSGTSEKYKLVTAIYVSQIILSSFTNDLIEQQKYIHLIRNSFAKEFGVEQKDTKLITPRYRVDRVLLEQVFGQKELKDEALAAMIKEVNTTKETYLSIISAIKQIDYPDGSFEEMYTLVSGHIHMFMNRFYSTEQRFFEFIMYGVWDNWMESTIKRKINERVKAN